jgi:hypothetical protein
MKAIMRNGTSIESMLNLGKKLDRLSWGFICFIYIAYLNSEKYELEELKGYRKSSRKTNVRTVAFSSHFLLMSSKTSDCFFQKVRE